MDFVSILASMNWVIVVATTVGTVLEFTGFIVWWHKRKVRKANEKAASDWENDFLTYR